MVTSIVQCGACGNRETINCNRSFLGFQKCTCTNCNSKFDDPSTPLSSSYRIIYQVLGVLCGYALFKKLPLIIAAATYGEAALRDVLLQNFFLILFVGGSIWALWKDAVIRKNNKPA